MSVTIQNKDLAVIKNIVTMGEHLKELKIKMQEAEALYEQAKKEYEYYSSSVLPMEMFSAGFTEIKLLDGSTLKYEQKYYCQPNKNDSDKRVMSKWLRAHGAEDLVKVKASVDGAQIDKLRDVGIPYTEIDDVNTQSLKAFLKNNLGSSFTLDEIPACMHFQEVSVCSIDYKEGVKNDKD